MNFVKYLGCAALTLGSVSVLLGETAEVDKPDFLFLDLVDAADCLGDIDSNDPIDVGRWTAIVTLEKERPVPNCASCYGHVDGSNIIGVLPVIKDTIREPFLIHSPSPPPQNEFYYRNHGPEWFWSISKVAEYDPSIDISNSSNSGKLAGLFTGNIPNVESDDIIALVSGPTESFNLPLPSDASSLVRTFGGTNDTYVESSSPFTQLIGNNAGQRLPGSLLNPSNYLVVPDNIRPLPDPNGPFPDSAEDFADYYALPYPKPAFIASTGALLESSVTDADPVILDTAQRDRLSMTLGSRVMGQLVSRNDPPLSDELRTPASQNETPLSYPAVEYYSTATIHNAQGLELCGVDYEVIEYGSVYHRILGELDAVLANHQPSASYSGFFWLDQGGNQTTDTNAYYSGITGFWTGKDLN